MNEAVPAATVSEAVLADGAVRLRRDGPLATITLDRPGKLNALTPAMIRALEQAVEIVEGDGEIRAALLTGAGERAFCVGADVLAWAELHDVPLSRVRAAFYYVHTGDVVHHDGLPGRAELERLVPGAPD